MNVLRERVGATYIYFSQNRECFQPVGLAGQHSYSWISHSCMSERGLMFWIFRSLGRSYFSDRKKGEIEVRVSHTTRVSTKSSISQKKRNKNESSSTSRTWRCFGCCMRTTTNHVKNFIPEKIKGLKFSMWRGQECQVPGDDPQKKKCDTGGVRAWPSPDPTSSVDALLFIGARLSRGAKRNEWMRGGGAGAWS